MSGNTQWFLDWARLGGRWPIGPRPVEVGGGNGNWSGRVRAIAVDPRDANILYLGAATGGVWKTTDGGASWTPLTDAQPSLVIGSLALDPANPDIIYAGTGEGSSCVPLVRRLAVTARSVMAGGDDHRANGPRRGLRLVSPWKDNPKTRLSADDGGVRSSDS